MRDKREALRRAPSDLSDPPWSPWLWEHALSPQGVIHSKAVATLTLCLCTTAYIVECAAASEHKAHGRPYRLGGHSAPSGLR